MKLKTRVQEVEAILITDVYGQLKITRNTEPGFLLIEIGEYIIFDPIRGLSKMDAKEIEKFYTVDDGEIDILEMPKERKKSTRGRKASSDNTRTVDARITNDSDNLKEELSRTL